MINQSICPKAQSLILFSEKVTDTFCSSVTLRGNFFERGKKKPLLKIRNLLNQMRNTRQTIIESKRENSN